MAAHGVKKMLRNNLLSLKILTIGFLGLLLLIPASMIQSLIGERQLREQEVVEEITQKWGGKQILAGPVLAIPYEEEVSNTRGEKSTVLKRLYILPERLEIKGDIQPEIRYRGIFEAVVYESQVKLSGVFSLAELDALNPQGRKLLLDQTELLIGLSDIRGIKNNIEFITEDRSWILDQGAANHFITQGVATKIKDIRAIDNKTFNLELSFRGSQALQIAPLGKHTSVTLTSPWNSPSFNGGFLPVNSQVLSQGFTALWEILSFNRGYPQLWFGEQYQIDNSLLGVDLLVMANGYQQSMRTSKYAVIFVAFTFMAFFLAEVFTKHRVHPIQYLLVGFSLLVFYTLLISISEHTSFGLAYLLAGMAVTALVAGYAKVVLNSKGMAWLVGGLLSLLYTYLYVLLQLESYALLMGSLGLFVVLAVVMYITRNFNWYALSFEHGIQDT